MKKSGFDEKTILSMLEELCQNLGIQLRYEQIKKEGSFYAGGLCRIKGETVMIINSNATNDDKIQVLARAVSSFDLSQVYLRPALREFLFKQEGPI
jgi:N-dimethylarginine dimethylaminohydrolase